MHKDYSRIHKIVKDAPFLAGLPALQREDQAHYAAGPYYAENWEDPDEFRPYIYSVLSEDGFKLWQEATNYHWFALNSQSFKYKDYYSNLKGVRGAEARVTYVEAFELDLMQKRFIKQGL